MRLAYATREEAQAKCDDLHKHAIETDDIYRASVEAGLTTKWCDPFQDTDRDGNAVSSDWYVIVDDRVVGGLSKDERATIPELKAADDAMNIYLTEAL